MHPFINHIGTWQLLKHGIRTGDSNPAESFNCVIKRIIEWTEKPVDVAARAMALTFQYYDTELLRGRYGLGEYNIIPSLGKVSEEPNGSNNRTISKYKLLNHPSAFYLVHVHRNTTS